MHEFSYFKRNLLNLFKILNAFYDNI